MHCGRPKPIIARRENRLSHQTAKFTLRPAFEDIDFTAGRSISKTQIKELYSLHDRPVLPIGQIRVGNTFIAQAAGLYRLCLPQIRAVVHDLARESGAG
jgi:hypothetical protein